MKKSTFFIVIALCAILTMSFVAYDIASNPSPNQYDTYQWEPLPEPTYEDSIVDSIAAEYFRLEPPFYLLTLQIRQSTFTLDIGEHIKNKANEVELTLAVDKRFYDSVEVGQEISDEWKLGSMLFDGDFSKLKIRVARKQRVSAKK